MKLIKIPEQLEGLEPKDRLNLSIKLMGFLLPKVRNVHMTEGEPFEIQLSQCCSIFKDLGYLITQISPVNHQQATNNIFTKGE